MKARVLASRHLLISAGLFLVALLPRVLSLGRFATADEAKWVFRSSQFLASLLRGDLSGTAVNLTPAVTTTWLGSLGLSVYYARHQADIPVSLIDWLSSMPPFRADLDLLLATRWPMVFLVSLGVVGLYELARRLVGGPMALVFGLLLALDPQLIGLSRVIGHDAPAGLFVGLSLLAFLVGVRSAVVVREPPSDTGGVDGDRGAFPADLKPGMGWFLLSGAMAGLAWLSKSPAFFLVPFVGLVVLLVVWRCRQNLLVWVLRLAVWAIIGWLVFVVFWPAAWQDPIGMPLAVVRNAFFSATDSVEAASEGYWLVPDLGVLYYPVNGGFKLAVLATLGLAAWLWSVLKRQPQREDGERFPVSTEWWLFAFALLFTMFMTAGGKRSNRYILPAWPALYLLAAIGLSRAWEYVRRSHIIGKQKRQPVSVGRWILYVALVGLLVLPAALTYPYYLTYFNPLLGGALTAPRLVKIGWGEGLDQVGSWLNEQENALALRVGSYYASALSPFFEGKVSGPTASGLDYVVLYSKQVQSGEPSLTSLRYFEAQEPVHSVHLDGIEYARVFAGPAMQSALAIQPTYDIGILPKPLSFLVSHPYMPIGQDATVEILWLAEEQLPADPSRLTVAPESDLTPGTDGLSQTVWAESTGRLERRPDGLVVSRHNLSVPPDLARGSYALLVDGRPLGLVDARQYEAPELDWQLDANFGNELGLLGASGFGLDTSEPELRLVWQASPRAWADYTVFLHLVDSAGNRVDGIDVQPSVPTSLWVRGEVVTMDYSAESEYGVPIPVDSEPGEYHLIVGLYRADTGERLPLIGGDGAALEEHLLLPVTITVD